MRFYRIKDDPAVLLAAWVKGTDVGMSADAGPLPTLHPIRPTGPADPSGPKGPGKIDSGPAGSKGRIGMQWVRRARSVRAQTPCAVESARSSV